jgi:molecular chaperone DnaK (HSP70)
MSGVTPAPRGEVIFELTYEIDANGILKATVVETKNKK